jgi:hypothetical protein
MFGHFIQRWTVSLYVFVVILPIRSGDCGLLNTYKEPGYSFCTFKISFAMSLTIKIPG